MTTMTTMTTTTAKTTTHRHDCGELVAIVSRRTCCLICASFDASIASCRDVEFFFERRMPQHVLAGDGNART